MNVKNQKSSLTKIFLQSFFQKATLRIWFSSLLLIADSLSLNVEGVLWLEGEFGDYHLMWACWNEEN